MSRVKLVAPNGGAEIETSADVAEYMRLNGWEDAPATVPITPVESNEEKDEE